MNALARVASRGQNISIVLMSERYLASALEVAREVHAASVYATLPLDERKLMQQLTAAGTAHPQRYFRLAVRGDYVYGGLYGCVQRTFFSDDLTARDLGWWVRRSVRGSAAAACLLADFEAWAKQQGARKIALGQTGVSGIEKTRQLFEHCGFTVVGYNVMKSL